MGSPRENRRNDQKSGAGLRDGDRYCKSVVKSDESKPWLGRSLGIPFRGFAAFALRSAKTIIPPPSASCAPAEASPLRQPFKENHDFQDAAGMNMSVEAEQSVSIPSVRLQLEQAVPQDLAANIRQVLVHPTIFFCAEILDIPIVQAELSRNQPLAALFDVFCFGTYQDLLYVPMLSTPVTDAEKHRIRMLTICTMAASESVLTFSDIQRTCGLADTDQAEDLCVHCMQASLLFGKIDQLKKCVTIENVAARDPTSARLIGIRDGLNKFAIHAASLSEATSCKAAALKAANEASAISTQKHSDLIRSQLQSLKEVGVDKGASVRSYVSKEQ